MKILMNLLPRLLLGCFFVYGCPCLAAQGIPPSERDALIELYNVTNGAEWVQNQNWLGAPGTEGSWHGVTVAAGHVTQIRLEANNLVGPLPSSLGHLPFLQELRLGSQFSSFNRNHLQSLPVAIGVLDQLRVLDLSSTQISALPGQIGELEALDTLILSFNTISRLPDQIGDLQALQRLEIANNSISDLPGTLGNLPNLRILNAPGNQIASLPESIGNLATLEELNLAGNRLTGLPASISGLAALKKLVLAENRIASLPAAFGTLSALQELDLGSNDLRTLTAGQVEDLTHLTMLNLTGNQLVSLPPEFGNLVDLRELYLGGNALHELPETIGNLTQLEIFFARSNQLERLPDGLGGMRNLVELDLFDNRLGAVPDGIGGLARLQRLELACNQITELPASAGDLQSLVSFSVADNALVSFPPGLGGLEGLERLNLRGNRLTGEVVAGLTNLVGLIRPIPQIIDSFLDLRWNALVAEGGELNDFIAQSQIGDFASTQTVPPGGISVQALNGSSARLVWEPIQFQDSDGGYEVFEARRPEGPFSFVGRTASKADTGFTVGGLDPTQDYFFTVRTLSLPHAGNRNSVLSDPSPATSVTTGASAEIYFPFLDSAADGFAGIAVSNHGEEGATLRFSIFDATGEPLDLPRNPASFQLPAGSQIAMLEPDIFGGGAEEASAGWVRLSSDSGRLGAVFLAGAASRLDGATGVGVQSTRFWFPVVLEGPSAYRGEAATTTISVANPNVAPVELELRLISAQSDGSRAVVSTTRQIAGRGFLRETIGGLFGIAAPPGSYVDGEVLEGAGAVGFAWIEFQGGRSTVGISALLPSGELKNYLAQWASSPEVFSDLQLVNTSQRARELTLRAVGRDGASLGDPVVVHLGAGAVYRAEAGSLFGSEEGAVTGSLELVADGPGIIGAVLFGDPNDLTFAASSPLRSQPFLEAEYSQAAADAGVFTGLALWNVGDGDGEVTVEAVGSDGTSIGAATRTLPPGGRLEELLSDLIPVTAGLRSGRVTIRSTQPLIGEELFGDYGLNYLSAVSPMVLRAGAHRPVQLLRSCGQ